MSGVIDIGLPSLSAEDIEALAEECELEVTRYIFQFVPEKSISELSVVCTLDFGTTLTFDLELDVSQKYDTGSSLDEILEQAAAHAQEWLESRLKEMKSQ
ncbi:MAG: DUF3194 domain-containing protein [Candidatus Thorarchaeota archaeon]|nr:DUF3194 domain-containing protein [Candidatus Thorarchaeota archaeon]